MATPRQKHQAGKNRSTKAERKARRADSHDRRISRLQELESAPARPTFEPFANEHGLVNWAAIAAAGIVASPMAEQVLADIAERQRRGDV